MATYVPVTVVPSGGAPFVQVSANAPPMTVVPNAAPITLVSANAPGVVLYNPDGSPYTQYDPSAVALFARFTTPPTDARKTLINNLIVSLKASSVWTKLDALYVMAAADNQAARRNWIADQYNLTAVSSPTFTADQGFTGDGAASYLTTALTPDVTTKYQLNNSRIGHWLRTNSQSASAVSLGARTSATPTGQSLILARTTSDTLVGRVNQDSNSGLVANLDSSSAIAVSRMASGTVDYYRAGVSIGSAAVSTTTMPTVPFFILALNNAGVPANYDTRQSAAVWVGSALTASEELAFYNALNTYLMAVGAA